MFERDYIMRLIKEMVRAILKLLFHIDTEAPTAEILQDAQEQKMLETLLDLVDDGKINEAENRLYDLIEDGTRNHLGSAVLFYSYLNDKSNEFLEEHDFSRGEVLQGLRDVASKYGLEAMAELFLPEQEE